jgi:hypothetical protein
MDRPLKRISLLIREDQYELIVEKELNLSGLVRDLIDDHFSSNAITISASKETKKLYDKIVSNTGTADSELEGYFRESLHKLLKEKINQMQTLEKSAFGRDK